MAFARTRPSVRTVPVRARGSLLVSVVLAACHPVPRGETSMTADLVLVGGDVITMDPERPRARSVAVRDGVVLAVGGDGEVRPHIGPKTRVVELHGRAVLPAF